MFSHPTLMYFYAYYIYLEILRSSLYIHIAPNKGTVRFLDDQWWVFPRFSRASLSVENSLDQFKPIEAIDNHHPVLVLSRSINNSCKTLNQHLLIVVKDSFIQFKVSYQPFTNHRKVTITDDQLNLAQYSSPGSLYRQIA